jgi:hypothetical protein
MKKLYLLIAFIAFIIGGSFPPIAVWPINFSESFMLSVLGRVVFFVICYLFFRKSFESR